MGDMNENFLVTPSTQARRRGGQEGAGAPLAFQMGEQGEQKCPFICNDLFSNRYYIQRRSYKLKASNI